MVRSPARPTCATSAIKKFVAKESASLKNWQWYAVVGASWKVMENGGKISKSKECGSIFPVRDFKQRSFERRPRRKSRKGYKVNGNKSLQQKNALNK